MNGPGASTPIVGDLQMGYFGSVIASELFTREELCERLNHQSDGPPITAWHKFSYNGKVLFYPDQVLYTRVGYNHLYKLGLIYGTRSLNQIPYGAVVSNGILGFGVTLKKDQVKYRVRAPHSRMQPLNSGHDGHYTGGEYDVIQHLAEALTDPVPIFTGDYIGSSVITRQDEQFSYTHPLLAEAGYRPVLEVLPD